MIRKGILLLILGVMGIALMTANAKNKIVIDKDIQLIQLQDSVFVHVTWHHDDKYGRFPSNGLIIIEDGQALMIDTPADNAKTERLTKYLKDSLSVDLTKLIIGHYHDDCMGGLEYLQGLGVESIANSMTIEKCKELNLPMPSTPFTGAMSFKFNGEPIVCRFFGAGHTFDNITVWMPNKKILFGGCLIKSVYSKGLGNLTDAVVADWDTTVKKLMKEYADIKTVIPGHGAFGGSELLSHTIELVEKEKRK
ncbi:subclass B1 metallo-beta-lactamase [Puteibacter caeruleilacunae]|nr:subclass B1 metallo-beta-lactamase [Puteibacter caeruleilacunae]